MTGAVISTIASQQHGIVARNQLLDAGLSPHAVDRRVKTGDLRRVHVGVYQVGPVIAPLAREMAAVIACGAVLSHVSAAAVRKVLPPQHAHAPVDVTITRGHRGRRPGIRIHRSRLADDEIDRIHGIPITSLARTLLDLSAVAAQRELERAWSTAERGNHGVRDEVLSILSRYGRRPGTHRLRELIESSAGPTFTRSEAEERLLALVRSGGLPQPELNVLLHGNEVDYYWRSARLVVEVDGYKYHSSPKAFVQDRQRDTALAAAGVQVLRLSWEQLTKQRAKTLVQLAQALARARA